MTFSAKRDELDGFVIGFIEAMTFVVAQRPELHQVVEHIAQELVEEAEARNAREVECYAERIREAEEEGGLEVAPNLGLRPDVGPGHSYGGSNKDRQSVGKPGHCLACAQVGHIAAHPEYDCPDVDCTSNH